MPDIKKYEPIPPMLPQIMGNAMPPQIPQMDWTSGLIKDLMHNWKLQRMQKASLLEAEIAESNLRKATAYSKMVHDLLTFQSNYNRAMKENEHAVDMMDLEKYLKHQQVQQESWKTKTMEVEFKTAELTYKQMLKEMGSDSPPADRPEE
jgi:hypothetical protein